MAGGGGGGDTPTTTGTPQNQQHQGRLQIAGALYKFKKISLGALIVKKKTPAQENIESDLMPMFLRHVVPGSNCNF